ncbi:MAG TPA: formyltransferase family protein [Acidobacteriota bacterium]
MKILLVAEESAGIQLLRALVQRNEHEISVFTSPPRASQNRATVWSVAESLGLSPQHAALVRDPHFGPEVRSRQVDILLNVHSLFIIHPEILKAPRLGCFNLHPGPLPRYAGLNAPSWAIYRGEPQHGVTVHRMEPEIDTGPIAFQALFDIDDNDTGLSLAARCITKGVPLMLRLINAAAADPQSIPRIEQDLTKREYFGREVPCNGKVSWSRPAREILNFIRAADYFPFPSPWGHPRTNRGALQIGVAKASRAGRPADAPPGTVLEPEENGVPIASLDEWILVQKVQVGEKFFSASEVLRAGDQLCNGHDGTGES